MGRILKNKYGAEYGATRKIQIWGKRWGCGKIDPEEKIVFLPGGTFMNFQSPLIG